MNKVLAQPAPAHAPMRADHTRSRSPHRLWLARTASPTSMARPRQKETRHDPPQDRSAPSPSAVAPAAPALPLRRLGRDLNETATVPRPQCRDFHRRHRGLIHTRGTQSAMYRMPKTCALSRHRLRTARIIPQARAIPLSRTGAIPAIHHGANRRAHRAFGARWTHSQDRRPCAGSRRGHPHMSLRICPFP